VFKALGHFPKSLYEFVTRYQELVITHESFDSASEALTR
jgi:hypothetical protein